MGSTLLVVLVVVAVVLVSVDDLVRVILELVLSADVWRSSVVLVVLVVLFGVRVLVLLEEGFQVEVGGGGGGGVRVLLGGESASP